MGDNEESESETGTFNVEFTAMEMYALHGLLRYLSIDMDQNQALVAQSLATQIHNTMASEEFGEAMEQEMDDFEEMINSPNSGNPMAGGMGGLNSGGFQ